MTSPQQAYSGKKASVDHMRVWGCKCIAYVNPSSLPPKTRHDKIVPRGREAVLVGYNPHTTKQWRIYAPDLGRCIKASSVTFFENEKGGDLDLKLKITTPHELPARKPVGRPRKEPIIHDIQNVEPASTQPEQATPEEEPRPDLIPVTQEEAQS